MKIKSLLNKAVGALFVLCLLLLIMHGFTKIKINFHDYFFHFWITYLISFVLIVIIAKRKIFVTILGIVPIIILSYKFFKTNKQTEIRKNIIDSPYQIGANMNGYSVIKKYYFLEKQVAKKESKLFFNANSKMGIVNPKDFDIKILENNNLIILEIRTQKNEKTIDSLVKNK